MLCIARACQMRSRSLAQWLTTRLGSSARRTCAVLLTARIREAVQLSVGAWLCRVPFAPVDEQVK
eukprot:9161627-Lingulodinium_polyedra.AAC.1